MPARRRPASLRLRSWAGKIWAGREGVRRDDMLHSRPAPALSPPQSSAGWAVAGLMLVAACRAPAARALPGRMGGGWPRPRWIRASKPAAAAPGCGGGLELLPPRSSAVNRAGRCWCGPGPPAGISMTGAAASPGEAAPDRLRRGTGGNAAKVRRAGRAGSGPVVLPGASTHSAARTHARKHSRSLMACGPCAPTPTRPRAGGGDLEGWNVAAASAPLPKGRGGGGGSERPAGAQHSLLLRLIAAYCGV